MGMSKGVLPQDEQALSPHNTPSLCPNALKYRTIVQQGGWPIYKVAGPLNQTMER